MGIRARNGNDRLRTVWTPEMDRYFIDLLLEQVSNGNKFHDHLFSKKAWKHMSYLFNAKFKFQCEKDVLKNRHKTLRNLYKAVNKILDHKGFNWDENRQMVIADNDVWDEYIKIHPDWRAFRIKTIPHYNDLCLIYGVATVEENGLLPLLPSENETVKTTEPKCVSEGAVEIFQEITIDEDYRICVSEVVDGSVSKGVGDDIPQATPNVTGITPSNRTRTYWQPPMDRYFIDLMLEQLQRGNQIDGVFRKQAWTDMIASFNARFGFNYDADVLKNRYKTLRRQHNVIKNLLEIEGFAWDETRQMVTADDYVWQNYLRTHTDARQFMTRPIPYYKDLCTICSDQNGDERDCFSALYSEPQSDFKIAKSHGMPQSSLSPAASSSREDDVGDMLDSAHRASEPGVSKQKNKRQLENQSNSADPKKYRGNEEGTATTLREVPTVVSPLLNTRKDENTNAIPIEKVIESIQAQPDMDEDLILDACDFLEDETRAKTFMALDVKLRKKWLLRKLRPES